MPTKLAVREMLPPKRLIWASRYSRSNISRASRSARPAKAPPSIPPLPLPPLPFDTSPAGSPRARSGRVGPRISARSSVLRSWRTLPGQRMVWSCASASGESAAAAGPALVQLARKWRASAGCPRAAPRAPGPRSGPRRGGGRARCGTALGDLAREVAGGGEITRTSTRTVLAPPDPLERLVDEHAQDLGLGAGRHVGDLVEEEDAAMARSKRPGSIPPARLAAEQHLLHRVGRDRGRVDHDEGSGGARAVAVDVARRDLLAAARRPLQHHAAVRAGDLVELRAQRAEGGLAPSMVKPRSRGRGAAAFSRRRRRSRARG
jgi:hypothetical protein